MRHLTRLLNRTPRPSRQPVRKAPEGVAETISAPKPRPRRCLNEGGHKLYR